MTVHFEPVFIMRIFLRMIVLYPPLSPFRKLVLKTFRTSANQNIPFLPCMIMRYWHIA